MNDMDMDEDFDYWKWLEVPKMRPYHTPKGERLEAEAALDEQEQIESMSDEELDWARLEAFGRRKWNRFEEIQREWNRRR